MQSVEAEGDSIDTAIDNALQQLGVARDQVEIEILTNAARGLLGFGARPARVRATLRAALDGSPATVGATETPLAGRPAAPSSSGAVSTTSDGDQHTADRARDILGRIVRLVGIDAGVDIRHEEGHIILDLTRDDSGILIGRRGQMLDALEYVLNRIILKDQSEAARIVVDSQGYRERRRAALEEMALRMADQAKKRRRPVALSPMSPRDRRTVHLALQDDPSLTTKSSGEGYYRQLVIIPKDSGRHGRPQP